MRIVYWNGSSWTELDRDIIDINTSSTQVWFKTQAEIGPSPATDNNYYMYYGNPGAGSPPANKSNVYLWFDDFNRADNSNITTEASYSVKTGGGNWSIETNKLKNVGDAGDPNKLIITALGNVSSDIDMLVKINVTSFAGDDLSRMGLSCCMDTDPSRGSGYCAIFHNDTGSLDFLNDLRSWGTMGNYSWSLNTWYYMRFRVIDPASKLGKVKVWQVGTTEPGIWTVDGDFGDGVARSYGEVGFVGSRNNDTTYFDDILIRYISDPEPSTSLGTEEERNIQDYVDNNASDVDSFAGKGTHGNFSAQQYGPDSIYDALTEENAGNWLSGWDKRVRIAINSTDINAPLTDFPVLIYLSNSSSGENDEDVSFVFDEVGSNSKKIAVTTGDSTTQCYVEIEKWDHTNEKAWLWVKVPSINSTADTDLYLYYDGSQSDNTAYVGDKESTPAQNVWNTNFKGVWHLDEDPSGTAPQMRDSTSNNNDGTSNGAMTSGDQIIGKIDGSLDFDGTNDYIQTTSSELKTLDNFTLSVWFKADSTTAPQHILWEGPVTENGWGDGSSPNSHEMHLTICKFDANNTLNFFYGYDESGDWAPAVEINMSFSDTTNWNHAVVVMTGAGTSPSAELFLNGVSQGTDTGTQTNRTAWDTDLRIGSPGADQRYFDGGVDE
ncbi:MAG: DUF2341 domain-containing protein, partial [Candidatus Bathyarchaeota archaeon]|nr:DUF2341 domain-containing protein [Candidatus Bathyarchaeota archaeon]